MSKRRKNLTVFERVAIPIDYASSQTYALLAKRDGGKTYTMLKFEEQMCDAGLFFVTLDPVGKHWALRAGADGSEKGGKKDVWVLGGQHGDVPLDPESGELIADTVVEHPGRYVLDVSSFETDAEQDRFALAFAKRLFRRKARGARFPLLLMLEEAESFIPERPQSGQQQMLGAFGRIVRQGRNHGLGIMMVAQRAQALNKGVLSQAEVLIVKQMAHNRDLAAVDAWVKANGTDEQRKDLIDSLAALDQPDAWVWSPSWLRVFKQTRVLARETFDSSASVRAHDELEDVELTPLDPEALGEQMKAVAEKTKAEDPKELRRQIAELKKNQGDPEAEEKVKELQQALEEERTREKEPEIVEVPLLSPETQGLLENMGTMLGSSFDELIGKLNEVATRVQEALTPAVEEQRRIRKAIEELRGARAAVAAPAARKREPRARSTLRDQPPQAPPRVERPQDNGSLSGPQQRVLDALAWLHTVGFERPTKVQVGFMAGYRTSKKVGGTFGNVLGQLHGTGLISYPRTGCAALTEAGRELAAVPQIEMTTEGLQEAVYARLAAPERRVLEVIIEQYPDSISKREAGERAGYAVGEKIGGTYGNVLGRLRSLGLVDYPGAGRVAAEPILFLE